MELLEEELETNAAKILICFSVISDFSFDKNYVQLACQFQLIQTYMFVKLL